MRTVRKIVAASFFIFNSKCESMLFIRMRQGVPSGPLDQNYTCALTSMSTLFCPENAFGVICRLMLLLASLVWKLWGTDANSARITGLAVRYHSDRPGSRSQVIG